MRPAASRDIEAEVLAELRRIVAEELGRSGQVATTDELATDLHLDSVQLLTLVVGLEDRFRIALAEEDAGEIRTVADLVRLISRRCAEEAPR